VDHTLAGLVAQGLGLTVPARLEGPLNLSIPADGNMKRFQPSRRNPSIARSPALSMANTVKDGIATRKVAILAADGVDEAAIAAMKQAMTAAGAQAKVVAPRLGVLKGAQGASVVIDFSFLTAGSVLFDAVYLPGGEASVNTLKGDAKALLFVQEAYLHCKTIAATDAGTELLAAAQPRADKAESPRAKDQGSDAAALAEGDQGIVIGRGAQISKVAAAFARAMAQHRHWDRESPALPGETKEGQIRGSRQADRGEGDGDS
jgi:catalase